MPHSRSKPKARPHPIRLPPVPPVEELLERERQARAEACQAAIAAALKRHNCRLQASVLITDGNPQSRVLVIALPPPGRERRAS